MTISQSGNKSDPQKYIIYYYIGKATDGLITNLNTNREDVGVKDTGGSGGLFDDAIEKVASKFVGKNE